MKVAMSILSNNKDGDILKERIEKLNKTDAEYLHVDVVDGRFVPNKTIDYLHLAESNKPLDVHLMVLEPFEEISKYAVMNTEAITIPLEIDEDIKSLLEYIHSRGIKCGLAINPETPALQLEPYFTLLDRVLVMSIHPGKSNQKFLDSVVYKIALLKKIREERHFTFEIFVDGGINDETVSKVSLADCVISDSFIGKQENYQEQIDKLRTFKN